MSDSNFWILTDSMNASQTVILSQMELRQNKQNKKQERHLWFLIKLRKHHPEWSNNASLSILVTWERWTAEHQIRLWWLTSDLFHTSMPSSELHQPGFQASFTRRWWRLSFACRHSEDKEHILTLSNCMRCILQSPILNAGYMPILPLNSYGAQIHSLVTFVIIRS